MQSIVDHQSSFETGSYSLQVALQYAYMVWTGAVRPLWAVMQTQRRSILP